MNDRFLRALVREPVDKTPVWIMRQAGRYLPEYRALREKAGSFLKMCTTPELACEVTLQPLRRFPLDAAIIFSDILTIPDAMGLGLHFVEGEGPKFSRPVRSKADIAALGVPDPERDLGYVMNALRLTRRELNGKVPLIGFSGAPWTLATYMVEGGASDDFRKIKALRYTDEASLHLLLDVLARSVTAYLNAQIAAGAQAVMIFDTWGGTLAPSDYRELSLAYTTRVLAGLTREHEGRRVPAILFVRNTAQYLPDLVNSGADALGLDWTADLAGARQIVNGKVALQGNLDPAVLYASPERIRAEVRRVLDAYGPGPGHVFNLGHGVPLDVSPEHVGILVDAVHEG